MRMTSAGLLDSNLLVYAYDPTDDAKQERAADLIVRLEAARLGALSAHTLGEFFSIVTRRIPVPLAAEAAATYVRTFAASWPVYPVTGAEVALAADAVTRYQMAYWDALLWATAATNRLDLILTEDLPGAGPLIGGVRYLNPLAEDFDLTSLGI
jgi:predicted nucleic acid-binding protein